MRTLNNYIKESIGSKTTLKEGLADWDEGDFEKSIKKETSKPALKKIITDWLITNSRCNVYKNKIKFDFNTYPITVDYDGDIQFKNHITSLTNGIFQWGRINGCFSCSYCTSLKTLEGAPKKVGRYFYCRSCDALKTLEGAPKEVGEYFVCENCKSLESLEGAPEIVDDFFSCSHCASLTSLKGAPKEVGDFNCTNCKSLKSLKGAPEIVNGCFDCRYCGVQFTEEDVKKVSKVKEKIYC